jgi:hypothetical protein
MCSYKWGRIGCGVTAGEATTTHTAVGPGYRGSGPITRIRELGEAEAGAPPTTICGDVLDDPSGHRPVQRIYFALTSLATLGPVGQ